MSLFDQDYEGTMAPYAAFVDGCVSLTPDTPRERILLGGFGLAGESGEVVDLLKKHVFHGKTEGEIRDKLVKELGDVLWYYTLILSTMDITLDEIIEVNHSKLTARHAEGYYEQGDGC